jgi:hypothetical protein
MVKGVIYGIIICYIEYHYNYVTWRTRVMGIDEVDPFDEDDLSQGN